MMLLPKPKFDCKLPSDRAKRYADQHRSDMVLQQGAKVLLSTKFIQLKVPGVNKLLPKYVGPFTISQVLGDVTYKLDLPASMKCHSVFHLSLLKPFLEDGRYQPPPLPFEYDEEEGLWYEVDVVLSHRTVKRGSKSILQYLCSFKGYDAAHNQWCDACGVTQAAKDEYHTRTNTVPPVLTTARKPKRKRAQSVTPADLPSPSVSQPALPASRFGRSRRPSTRFT